MSETPDDKSVAPTDQSSSGAHIEEALIKAREDIASLKDLLNTAEAAKATIQEHLIRSTTILAEIQARDRELTALATQSLVAKTQITDAQAVIVTKSDHIQNAQ